MDGQRLRVDRAQLAEVMEEMAKVTKSVDELLESTDRSVSRLHLTWTGEAASAHAQAHEKWVKAARQMHEALDDLRVIGLTAHANYNSAVEANLKMWRR